MRKEEMNRMAVSLFTSAAPWWRQRPKTGLALCFRRTFSHFSGRGGRGSEKWDGYSIPLVILRRMVLLSCETYGGVVRYFSNKMAAVWPPFFYRMTMKFSLKWGKSAGTDHTSLVFLQITPDKLNKQLCLRNHGHWRCRSRDTICIEI